MAKRLVLVMIALALVAAGCGGAKQQAELEDSGASSATRQTGDTGDDEAARAAREAQSSTDVGEYDFLTIYFDFDKYNLRADAREALDRNAEILRANPDLRIVIEGHCDERGTDEYNLALGEKRAKSARDYLVRLGVDDTRVNIISYGEERPVSPGHDEDSWRMNRRGQFVPR